MKRSMVGLLVITASLFVGWLYAADPYAEGVTRTAVVGEVIYADTQGGHPATYFYAGVTNGGNTLVLRKRVVSSEKLTEYFDLFIPLGATSSYALTIPVDWIGDIRMPGVRIVGQADAALPGSAVMTFAVDNYQRLLMLVDRAASPKRTGLFE